MGLLCKPLRKCVDKLRRILNSMAAAIRHFHKKVGYRNTPKLDKTTNITAHGLYLRIIHNFCGRMNEKRAQALVFPFLCAIG